jgi:hypothetical protein
MEFNHSLAGFLFSRFLLVGLFSLLVQKKEKFNPNPRLFSITFHGNWFSFAKHNQPKPFDFPFILFFFFVFVASSSFFLHHSLALKDG